MDAIIHVTKASLPVLDEYVKEIKDIWDSRWLTNMGEKHQEFQQALKKKLAVENIELLTNGHMALELSLQALGLNRGEVITTPFTFASTTHAIVRNGLTPVFCDIRLDDFTIDAEKIEKLITKDTVAIMPVHVYGNICDVEKIEQIAKAYNLMVVYDAAHAFGETYKGRNVASFGDVSCFSFHATKVFNSIEGGAACFSDVGFGKKLYQLKNFGIKDQETVDGVGANAKMNEFCAAMGICNLRHLDEEISKRKNISDLYYKELGDVEGIQLNCVQNDVEKNYSYFPVVINSECIGYTRDELKDELLRNGIEARKYFYPLCNEFDCYKGMFTADDTPIAKKISSRVLTLPLYGTLSEEVALKVCQIIKSKGKKR